MPMSKGMAALEPAFLLGLGAVAIWLYLRFPSLRPGTMARAIVHVAASFFLFGLVPYGVGFSLHTLPATVSLVAIIFGMLIPTLSYVLLSWIWLMARIHDVGNSLPRGGHRVRADASS
jgi:hypothetical protein